MKIGILKAGSSSPVVSHHGDYPAMFRSLLGPDTFDYVTFDVEAGELPSAVTTCAGYIVTGSPHDAYADTPWIVQLRAFLEQAKGQSSLVGVCFGHQVMAEAFGGKVTKAAGGWGIGIQRYAVSRSQALCLNHTTLTLPAFHQDQVVVPPPGAEVAGGNDFCRYGILVYPGARAISLQLHPEFTADYVAALAEIRRHNGLSDAAADAAIASAASAIDRTEASEWIGRFLRGGDLCDYNSE